VNRLKRHLTVANVLSCTALFIALGGTAFAAARLNVGEVKAVNLAPQSVTQQKLHASAVTSGKIANGQVKTRDLASYGITPTKIGVGAVIGSKIANGAITQKKFGKKAVTAAALGPEAVTNAKLGAESVSQNKLATSLYSQLIKNVSYVTETSISNGTDNEKSVTALCPVGKEVIGGGARIIGATSKTVVSETAPALVGTAHPGWYASGREVSEETGNWAVSAFAICATL
jgi:hypothetical protein